MCSVRSPPRRTHWLPVPNASSSSAPSPTPKRCAPGCPAACTRVKSAVRRSPRGSYPSHPSRSPRPTSPAARSCNAPRPARRACSPCRTPPRSSAPAWSARPRRLTQSTGPRRIPHTPSPAGVRTSPPTPTVRTSSWRNPSTTLRHDSAADPAPYLDRVRQSRAARRLASNPNAGHHIVCALALDRFQAGVVRKLPLAAHGEGFVRAGELLRPGPGLARLRPDPRRRPDHPPVRPVQLQRRPRRGRLEPQLPQRPWSRHGSPAPDDLSASGAAESTVAHARDVHRSVVPVRSPGTPGGESDGGHMAHSARPPLDIEGRGPGAGPDHNDPG
jgi:hypothetical protein